MKRLYSILSLSALFFFSCSDMGIIEPVVPSAAKDIVQSISVDGWYQTPVRAVGHSLWLDFVSIETDNSTIPIELRQDSTFNVIHFDSIRVINHSDRDTVYIGTGFDYFSGGVYHKRFYFPDGYTDRFPPTTTPNLSVFLRYN